MESFQLRQGGVLRIENRAGVVVEVSRGGVWLTQEHDPRDYFLRARDWLRIDRKGAIVISAVGEDASISLTRAAQAA